jgi:hypothetical protein
MNHHTVEAVNRAELYQVISDASSQDPSRVQRATQRLKELLDLFGTFEALQEIAAQRDQPLALRQQAMIQLKNSALNHWKSRKHVADTRLCRCS